MNNNEINKKNTKTPEIMIFKLRRDVADCLETFIDLEKVAKNLNI